MREGTSLVGPMRVVGIFLAAAAVALLADARVCRGDMELDPATIRTVITGRMATTTMDLVFRRPDDKGVDEGSLTFKLPADAAVYEMALWVDGVRCPGSLLGRSKARQIYEEIVGNRRDPAILEYQGEGRWSLQVFPVPAKGQRKVQVVWCQYLRASEQWIAYQGPDISEMPVGSLDVSVEVRAPGGVKDVVCSSHDAGVQRLPDGGVRVAFRQATGDAGVTRAATPVDVSYRPERPVPDVVTFLRGKGQRYFVTTVPPTNLLRHEKPAPRDVVLVVDHSGSAAASVLAIAVQTAEGILDGLEKEDRFAVVAAASDVTLWQKKLSPATVENVLEAKRFIERLKGQGGTDLAAGLRAAASYAQGTGKLDVFLLSHGWDVVGAPPPAAEGAVKDAKPQPVPGNVRVHCYDPVGSSWGMWALSHRTGGMYSRLAGDETNSGQAPGWTIPVNAYRNGAVVGASVSAPEGVGLAAMLPADRSGLVIGQAGRNARVELTLRGRAGDQEVAQTITVKLPEASEDDLWVTGDIDKIAAFLRAESLWDRLGTGEPSLAALDELSDVCRAAGVAGRATSILVLESDEEYAVRGIVRAPTTVRAGRRLGGVQEDWQAAAARAGAADGKGPAVASLKAAAKVLRDQGRVEQALARLQEAAKLAPGDAEVAQAMTVLNQFLGMRQAYRQDQRMRQWQETRLAGTVWTDTMMAQESTVLYPAGMDVPRAAQAAVDPARAGADARADEVRRKMQTPLPALAVKDVKFRDFLRQLSEAAGVNIHAHWDKLESVDVGPDLKVNLAAKDISPQKAMDLVLTDLSFRNLSAAWRIEDNVVVVTSRAHAEQREALRRVTRVYDVRRVLLSQPTESAQMGLVLTWVPSVSENVSSLQPVWDVARIPAENDAMARLQLGNVVGGPVGVPGAPGGAAGESGRPFTPDFTMPRVDVTRLGQNQQSGGNSGIFGDTSGGGAGLYGAEPGGESPYDQVISGEDVYGRDRVQGLLRLCGETLREVVQGDARGTLRFRDGMLVVTHTPEAQAAVDNLLAGLTGVEPLGAQRQRAPHSAAVEPLFTADGRVSEWVAQLMAAAREGKCSEFSSVQVRKVGKKTFARIGGYWFDTDIGPGAVIEVASPAGAGGQAILAASADSKAWLALGPRVVVSFGASHAVCFDPKGSVRLDAPWVRAFLKPAK